MNTLVGLRLRMGIAGSLLLVGLALAGCAFSGGEYVGTSFDQNNRPCKTYKHGDVYETRCDYPEFGR